MAEFPDYVCVSFDNYSESFDPSVERTEMERGPAKQRRINSRVEASINATLTFMSKADAASFESWYFDTIQRIGYFDIEHPRTGQTISARFRGGDIGELTTLTPDFEVTQRQVVLEYMR